MAVYYKVNLYSLIPEYKGVYTWKNRWYGSRKDAVNSYLRLKEEYPGQPLELIEEDEYQRCGIRLRKTRIREIPGSGHRTDNEIRLSFHRPDGKAITLSHLQSQ